MYNQVFISHSKDDPNLDFFHRVFSGITTRSVWMEFEEIASPPYETIKRKVNESDAIWVLLSRYLLRRAHTNNWVSFEIGLASNRPRLAFLPLTLPQTGIDIYVFEPSSSPVDFPVPCCNFYMPYEGSTEELIFLKKVVEAAPYLGNAPIPVRCPYSECGIEFKLLKDIRRFICPACRGRIEFKAPTRM